MNESVVVEPNKPNGSVTKSNFNRPNVNITIGTIQLRVGGGSYLIQDHSTESTVAVD